MLKKMIALLLAAALVCGLLAGCAKSPAIQVIPPQGEEDEKEPAGQTPGGEQPQDGQPGTEQPGTQKPEEGEPSGTKPEDGQPAVTPEGPDSEPVTTLVTPRSYHTAESYAEVYAAITTRRTNGYWEGGAGGGDFVDEDVAESEVEVAESEAPMAPVEAPADVAASAPAADTGGGEYSETNVQVAGIDEADIVKTDGRYIYLLRRGELTILEAAGPNTREVSKLILELKREDGYENAEELFYEDGMLAIITSGYSYDEVEEEDGSVYYDSQDMTRIIFIDVNDRANPGLAGTYQQEGWYNSARLLNGVVYLVSSTYMWNFREEMPQTFVPRYAVNGVSEVVAPGDILLPEEPGDDEWYIMVSTVEMASRKSSRKAILGQSETVYMTENALYLASDKYEEHAGEPYARDQYSVVDYVSGQVTTILRLSLDLELEACGAVDGYLLNQFALDEQDGTLRVVTTVSRYAYSIYTDEAYGFTNYVSNDEQSRQHTDLYVLDDDLAVVGSVTDLAEGERVYSVRYQGEYAYVVTFRQTDPLFVIDLTDPTAPEVASELILPGFSRYLHMWQDGLLFGLGQNVSEEGWTDGMKLSMFDVSDPTATAEVATLALDADYSEALYNHKAILISPRRNLIGIPSYMGYLVYSYSEEEGFQELGRVVEASWGYEARALYIGSYLYLVSPDFASVLDLENFQTVWEHWFAMG